MNIWPAYITKQISVIASSGTDIRCYSKTRKSTDTFVELSGSFTYMNDDVWELDASFPVGEYVIKVVVDSVPTYVGLSVVTQEQYDHTINQDIIESKIDSKNSWKISG